MTITLLRWARLEGNILDDDYVGEPPDMTQWMMKHGEPEYMFSHYGGISSASWLRWQRAASRDDWGEAVPAYKRPPLTRVADTLFLQYMQSSKRGLRAWLLLHAVILCELFERREAW